MSSESKPVRVFLTGGLGNQLFQLAAGLAKAGNGIVILDPSFGNFKHSRKALPEICDFNLPANTIFENRKKRNILAKKMFNLILRLSSNNQPFTNSTIRNVIRKTAAFGIKFVYLGTFQIFASSVTGYDSKLLEKKTRSPIALIGYFQTYKYVETESVLEKINKISPKSADNLSSVKNKLDLTRNALALHIRKGDYSSEGDIGLLSPEYFENALNFAFTKDQFDDIWLFTNSETAVMEAIPRRFHSKIINFSEFNLNTEETFQIMRKAAGYILSNSTFGWWAAELSLSKEPLVIAPTPWFRKLESPCNLIKNDWLQAEATFLG